MHYVDAAATRKGITPLRVGASVASLAPCEKPRVVLTTEVTHRV